MTELAAAPVEAKVGCSHLRARHAVSGGWMCWKCARRAARPANSAHEVALIAVLADVAAEGQNVVPVDVVATQLSRSCESLVRSLRGLATKGVLRYDFDRTSRLVSFEFAPEASAPGESAPVVVVVDHDVVAEFVDGEQKCWRVSPAPCCGRQSHLFGATGEDPRAFLGIRRAPCGKLLRLAEAM